jgi:hypothetical protein
MERRIDLEERIFLDFFAAGVVGWTIGMRTGVVKRRSGGSG